MTVEVLEELPGDPYPWYHVRIGRTEGYMSGIYVAYPGSVCSMEPPAKRIVPAAHGDSDRGYRTEGRDWLV